MKLPTIYNNDSLEIGKNLRLLNTTFTYKGKQYPFNDFGGETLAFDDIITGVWLEDGIHLFFVRYENLLLPPINSGSCNVKDPYVVYDHLTMRKIETHATEEKAEKATKILNEHSEKNGEGAKYSYLHRKENRGSS